MPGVSRAAGVALLMVLRSGLLDLAQNMAPDRWGSRDMGVVCSGWAPHFPRGDWATGAWCQPGVGFLSLPQLGGCHSTP